MEKKRKTFAALHPPSSGLFLFKCNQAEIDTSPSAKAATPAPLAATQKWCQIVANKIADMVILCESFFFFTFSSRKTSQTKRIQKVRCLAEGMENCICFQFRFLENLPCTRKRRQIRGHR